VTGAAPAVSEAESPGKPLPEKLIFKFPITLLQISRIARPGEWCVMMPASVGAVRGGGEKGCYVLREPKHPLAAGSSRRLPKSI